MVKAAKRRTGKIGVRSVVIVLFVSLFLGLGARAEPWTEPLTYQTGLPAYRGDTFIYGLSHVASEPVEQDDDLAASIQHYVRIGADTYVYGIGNVAASTQYNLRWTPGQGFLDNTGKDLAARQIIQRLLAGPDRIPPPLSGSRLGSPSGISLEIYLR